MLVLTRNEDEVVRLDLGDGRIVYVTVVAIQHGVLPGGRYYRKARLGFTAPQSVKISRPDLKEGAAACPTTTS
jgi:sRNA-binding carbon storage regulator CsrA